MADVTVDSALLELRLEVVNEIAAHLCASHLTVCSHLIKGFGMPIFSLKLILN